MHAQGMGCVEPHGCLFLMGVFFMSRWGIVRFTWLNKAMCPVMRDVRHETVLQGQFSKASATNASCASLHDDCLNRLKSQETQWCMEVVVLLAGCAAKLEALFACQL